MYIGCIVRYMSETPDDMTDIAEGYDNTNQIRYKLRRVDDHYEIVANNHGNTCTVAEGDELSFNAVTTHLERCDVPDDVIADYTYWVENEGIHRAMDDDNLALVMLGKNKIGFGYEFPFGDYGVLPTYTRTRTGQQCEYVATIKLE